MPLPAEYLLGGGVQLTKQYPANLGLEDKVLNVIHESK